MAGLKDPQCPTLPVTLRRGDVFACQLHRLFEVVHRGLHVAAPLTAQMRQGLVARVVATSQRFLDQLPGPPEPPLGVFEPRLG